MGFPTYVHEKIWVNHASNFIKDLGTYEAFTMIASYFHARLEPEIW